MTAIWIFFLSLVSAQRRTFLLDDDWRFSLGDTPPSKCTTDDFPQDYANMQCLGLTGNNASTLSECIQSCCEFNNCQVYQFCEKSSCTPGCWIGQITSQCKPADGWNSRARNATTPPVVCDRPQCDPSTDDSQWRQLNLPHDFVLEGNFTPTADKAHGYLPFGVGWYRKHFSSSGLTSKTLYLDFEGIQTRSEVYLNGHLLGWHASGYTPSRYFIDPSLLKPQGNVLAVKADASAPDGWWYDGGGIYRHVWLTSITSPGPFIAPWGVYTPSSVQGTISWDASGVPSANATLSPQVEIWSNSSTSQSFQLKLIVSDRNGTVLATSSGSGSVTAGQPAVWTANSPIVLGKIELWHTVARPNLLNLQTTLLVGSSTVDVVNVTFGVRSVRFDAAKGFFLNEANIKIRGTANHQDFAGVGVAVPDKLQLYRVGKLQSLGLNGWRTAHNPPNPALLHATDELGMVVWDENHRNGQDAEAELLIRRDRNHPSVVIWSICNEVLCDTSDDWVTNAKRINKLMHNLDPLSGRPVSANQNGWVGPSTPLDVQGFDYNTNNYDSWHKQAPQIPSISSETSSAVSDRGEYVNDENLGLVSGYDVNYPSWGESTQQAWGGIGMANGQGIFTRDFISGGWTWTGFDYKGEPTPYAWPDINSHFGILDIAGFEKDRAYWYTAWNTQPHPPSIWLFPHWNWDANFDLPIWVYSNADEVELFVNGQSVGRKPMPQYGHVEWTGVKYVAGSIRAVGYSKAGNVEAWRNTTGSAKSLRISVRDNFGASLVASCNDVALIQVEIVDSAGAVVPTASDTVTFRVAGPGTFLGGGNGNPACHTSDLSPSRPAYHGLVLAVVQGGNEPGTITVEATAEGLATATLQIPLREQPSNNAFWCHQNVERKL